jgi:hypothetical protein
LMAGGASAQPAAPEAIERFSYTSIASEMTDAVERAITHRARA